MKCRHLPEFGPGNPQKWTKSKNLFGLFLLMSKYTRKTLVSLVLKIDLFYPYPYLHTFTNMCKTDRNTILIYQIAKYKDLCHFQIPFNRYNSSSLKNSFRKHDWRGIFGFIWPIKKWKWQNSLYFPCRVVHLYIFIWFRPIIVLKSTKFSSCVVQ